MTTLFCTCGPVKLPSAAHINRDLNAQQMNQLCHRYLLCGFSCVWNIPLTVNFNSYTILVKWEVYLDINQQHICILITKGFINTKFVQGNSWTVHFHIVVNYVIGIQIQNTLISKFKKSFSIKFHSKVKPMKSKANVVFACFTLYTVEQLHWSSGVLYYKSLGSPKSLTVPASRLLSYLPSLSSQAKAKSGRFGCHATVKVGESHCTSHSFSPIEKYNFFFN